MDIFNSKSIFSNDIKLQEFFDIDFNEDIDIENPFAEMYMDFGFFQNNYSFDESKISWKNSVIEFYKDLNKLLINKDKLIENKTQVIIHVGGFSCFEKTTNQSRELDYYLKRVKRMDYKNIIILAIIPECNDYEKYLNLMLESYKIPIKKYIKIYSCAFPSLYQKNLIFKNNEMIPYKKSVMTEYKYDILNKKIYKKEYDNKDIIFTEKIKDLIKLLSIDYNLIIINDAVTRICDDLFLDEKFVINQHTRFFASISDIFETFYNNENIIFIEYYYDYTGYRYFMTNRLIDNNSYNIIIPKFNNKIIKKPTC